MEKRTRTEGEILEELEVADVNIPWLYRWTRISHYYGDTVRELLISAAILMLIASPFYLDDVDLQLPFIVVGAVVVIGAAALTNPWKRSIISADAVVSSIGLMIFQIWALRGYKTDATHMFVLREAIAIIFLFAFYFSTKTLRSMVLNKIGQPDMPDEFVTGSRKPTANEIENMNWKQQAHDALAELNEQEKIDYSD